MDATQQRTDAAKDTAKVRLRVKVFDALAAAKGADTNAARARLVGTHRATLIRLRQGQIVPGLDLAMRIADQLGVAIEDVFERVEEIA